MKFEPNWNDIIQNLTRPVKNQYEHLKIWHLFDWLRWRLRHLFLTYNWEYLTLLQKCWRYRTLVTTGFNTMGTPPHSAAAAVIQTVTEVITKTNSCYQNTWLIVSVLEILVGDRWCGTNVKIIIKEEQLFPKPNSSLPELHLTSWRVHFVGKCNK